MKLVGAIRFPTNTNTIERYPSFEMRTEVIVTRFAIVREKMEMKYAERSRSQNKIKTAEDINSATGSLILKVLFEELNIKEREKKPVVGALQSSDILLDADFAKDHAHFVL